MEVSVTSVVVAGGTMVLGCDYPVPNLEVLTRYIFLHINILTTYRHTQPLHLGLITINNY